MVKKVRNEDDADLAKEATQQNAREKAKGGGNNNKISLRSKKFTFQGELIGRTMDCVVVDFVYLRTYYGEKFDETNPAPPVCFALSVDGEGMKPHKNSADIQNRICETCPQNKPGSGGGKRRACQTRRRFALLHADDIGDAESVAEATMPSMEVSVKSVFKWGAYLDDLAEKTKRPFYTVLTKLAFDEEESYPVVTYELSEKLTKDIYGAVKERQEEAREAIMTPYPKQASKDDDEDEEEEKPKKKKKVVEDEDEEDEPAPKKKAVKKKKKVVEEDEEDEDDEADDEDDEDEDEDEEEETPKKKTAKKKAVKKKVVEEDDEDDDEDEDDEDEDEDDEEEEEEAPKKKPAKKKAVKKKVVEEDDEDEDEDDEADDEDDEDEEEEAPKKTAKKKAVKKKVVEKDDDEDEDEDEDDEDEDDEDEDEEDDTPPTKKKKSRFSR